MTELQQIEFEMLKAAVEICDRLGLTYYLVCGSALGAAKYQGFIPWDDDIDIALPREDYRVFCREAQKYLPDYYFLQTHRTDPHYPWFSAKLRDSRTTYIEKAAAGLDIHHGVFIDIFPLDGYPADPKAQKKLELQKKIRKLLLISAYAGDYSLKVVLLMKIFRFIGVHKRTAGIAEKLEKVLSAHALKNSLLWCNHANWQGKLEYAPCEQYGQGTWTTFEGLPVRIPQQYDAYLTQKYGDWRADLPEEQKVGHHYYGVMDLHKSYTTYRAKQ